MVTSEAVKVYKASYNNRTKRFFQYRSACQWLAKQIIAKQYPHGYDLALHSTGCMNIDTEVNNRLLKIITKNLMTNNKGKVKEESHESIVG